MKYLTTIILILFVITNIFAKGIEFFHGTWEEALEKAKNEEKIIFVDAYAEWCGPCKRMARNVFTDSEVGDFYNSSFINLKIDMEKPENATFSKAYPVAAFPTLYFIDFTGEVVQKIKGAQSVEQFINLGKSVVSKTDRSAFYAEAYEGGDRSPELVYNYVKALNKVDQSTLKIANEYLSNQEDLTSEQNLLFLLEATTEVDSRIFDLMIQHRAAIEKLTSPQIVKERIEKAGEATLDKAIAFESEDLLEEAQEKIKKHYPEKANKFLLESEMIYAKKSNDPDRYLKAWTKFVKKEAGQDAAEQSLLAVSLAEAFPTNEKAIDAAVKVAKSAADKSDTFDPKFTYAKLLWMSGDKEAARKAGAKAMYVAKNSGDQRDIAVVVRLMRMLEE